VRCGLPKASAKWAGQNRAFGRHFTLNTGHRANYQKRTCRWPAPHLISGCAFSVKGGHSRRFAPALCLQSEERALGRVIFTVKAEASVDWSKLALCLREIATASFSDALTASQTTSGGPSDLPFTSSAPLANFPSPSRSPPAQAEPYPTLERLSLAHTLSSRS
jgi:hypothetical protein